MYFEFGERHDEIGAGVRELSQGRGKEMNNMMEMRKEEELTAIWLTLIFKCKNSEAITFVIYSSAITYNKRNDEPGPSKLY